MSEVIAFFLLKKNNIIYPGEKKVLYLLGSDESKGHGRLMSRLEIYQRS
jgi:hypothetical protein